MQGPSPPRPLFQYKQGEPNASTPPPRAYGGCRLQLDPNSNRWPHEKKMLASAPDGIDAQEQRGPDWGSVRSQGCFLQSDCAGHMGGCDAATSVPGLSLPLCPASHGPGLLGSPVSGVRKVAETYQGTESPKGPLTGMDGVMVWEKKQRHAACIYVVRWVWWFAFTCQATRGASIHPLYPLPSTHATIRLVGTSSHRLALAVQPNRKRGVAVGQ